MTEELQELESIEEPPPPPPEEPTAEAPRPGAPSLPAPAYNPAADKEYYRFLFAGLVMFIGCLMPFGPDWSMAGYKTLSGAVFTLIAIGMIWSWWGAIATGRFTGKNLKWVGLCIIPLIVELMNLIGAFDAPAVRAAIDAGDPISKSWGEFFESFFARELEAQNFVRNFGAGKIVVFIGALLAEASMLLAVFGGAKAAKAQKTQRAANKAGRRR
jgi:hypothetical protein